MASRRIEVARQDDVWVVRFLDQQLSGDLPDQLGADLYDVAAQQDCSKILLSFAGVDFLASDMLGKVVVLNKKMKQKGGQLALCEVCPYIRQILVTTRLDSILATKATESEGLAAFA